MNIYDIFQRSAKGHINLALLKSIRAEHCPNIPFALLCHHRKLYHLQLSQNYWAPVNRKAKPSEVGNYIDARGEILDTDSKVPRSWQDNAPFYTFGQDPSLYKKLRAARDADYEAAHRSVMLKKLNVVFINEYTIPKWDPRSLTVCLDRSTEISERIHKLLNYKFLVLRAKPLGNDQYELWTLNVRTMKLKTQIATLIGSSLGLGKSLRGSRYSAQVKVTNTITETLT